MLQSCMAFETEREHYQGCHHLYAVALLRGEGVERNEQEAFRILAPMGAGAAAELADLYDRGVGVARDPIMAAVYAWSATHDSNFGLCSAGCDDTHLTQLAARLDAELSNAQRDRVNGIIAERFPVRVLQYQRYDVLHWTIVATMGSVFVWICWMTYSPGRKRRSAHVS